MSSVTRRLAIVGTLVALAGSAGESSCQTNSSERPEIPALLCEIESKEHLEEDANSVSVNDESEAVFAAPAKSRLCCRIDSLDPCRDGQDTRLSR